MWLNLHAILHFSKQNKKTNQIPKDTSVSKQFPMVGLQILKSSCRLYKICFVRGKRGNKVVNGCKQILTEKERKKDSWPCALHLLSCLTVWPAQQHSWTLCLCPMYSLAHPAPALQQPHHGPGRVTWAVNVSHQTHLQHSGQWAIQC